MPIDIHLLNATGALNGNIADIDTAFKVATTQARRILRLRIADVVIGNSPGYAIPELGVGGYTDFASRVIHVSIDPKKKPTSQAIEACLSHEFYHLVRHRRVGVPVILKARIIDEGLACLYEFEVTGEMPIYAQQNITDKYLALFMKHMNDKNDTDKWFFGGGGIPKWFGYTLGFKLAARYKNDANKNAPQLIGISNKTLYDKTLGSARLSVLD